MLLMMFGKKCVRKIEMFWNDFQYNLSPRLCPNALQDPGVELNQCYLFVSTLKPVGLASPSDPASVIRGLHRV